MFYAYLFPMQLRWTSRGSGQNHSKNRPADLSSFYMENYRNLIITTSHKVYLLHSTIDHLLYANCKWVRFSDTRVSLIWASLSQTFLVEARSLFSLISCWSVIEIWKCWLKDGSCLIGEEALVMETSWLRGYWRKVRASFVTFYSGIRIKSLERSPSWKANSWTASQ